MMMEKQGIELPRGVVSNAADAEIEKMVDVVLFLEPLWENALGKGWVRIMTRGKIRALYEKMCGHPVGISRRNRYRQ